VQLLPRELPDPDIRISKRLASLAVLNKIFPWTGIKAVDYPALEVEITLSLKDLHIELNIKSFKLCTAGKQARSREHHYRDLLQPSLHGGRVHAKRDGITFNFVAAISGVQKGPQLLID
jgi:hypothetical protein